LIGSLGLAWHQSNAAGKIIVVLLFIGSIFAWSIMLTKFRQISQARKRSQTFIDAYRRENDPVALFIKRRRYDPSPLYTIYEHTCGALGSALESRGADPSDLFMGGIGAEQRCLGKIDMSSVRNVAERTMADECLLLENSMGLLATAASTAPFLGLLGTVWGVMDAFGGMVVKGSAMLSEVAPGISGALLTTVVGLLVALPSAIGYNTLSDRIRRFSVEIDNFTQELTSNIEGCYLSE
jgi:biopolymer transport protein TolQ